MPHDFIDWIQSYSMWAIYLTTCSEDPSYKNSLRHLYLITGNLANGTDVSRRVESGIKVKTELRLETVAVQPHVHHLISQGNSSLLKSM